MEYYGRKSKDGEINIIYKDNCSMKIEIIFFYRFVSNGFFVICLDYYADFFINIILCS